MILRRPTAWNAAPLCDVRSAEGGSETRACTAPRVVADPAMGYAR